MLVSDVIDRCYSEWIYPGGINLPAFDTVKTAGVLAGSTEGTFELDGLIANVPDQSIIEIDDELILTKTVTGTAPTVTVTTAQRGYLDTAAVSHAAGSKVYLDPKFSRVNLFNALKTVVGTLYPLGLYQRQTDSSITWDSGTVADLPADCEDIISLVVRRSGSIERYTMPLIEGKNYRVLREFSPAKLYMLSGGIEQQTVTFSFMSDFAIPATTADDLDTIGIPTSLQPVLPMAMAGYLLQGRELPRVQIEEVRRQLASQGIQVGAAVNIGQLLIRTFETRYVAYEKARLREKDGIRFAFARS